MNTTHTTDALRRSPAFARVLRDYLADRDGEGKGGAAETVARLRRASLLGRARIVAPALRAVTDDEALRVALAAAE